MNTQSLDAHDKRAPRAGAVLGVIGVVYGDIGTSPLYAVKASLQVFAGVPISETEILGLM